MTDGIQTLEVRDQLERRAKICELEAVLACQDGAVFGDSECAPLEHFFADGIYCRKITLPKGLMCVGKIHRHEHPAFLLKGRVRVYTEQAGTEEISAPAFMISPAGTKRAVFALEDTEWYTIHRTDQTDLEAIEQEVITNEFPTLDAAERKELT